MDRKLVTEMIKSVTNSYVTNIIWVISNFLEDLKILYEDVDIFPLSGYLGMFELLSGLVASP